MIVSLSLQLSTGARVKLEMGLVTRRHHTRKGGCHEGVWRLASPGLFLIGLLLVAWLIRVPNASAPPQWEASAHNTLNEVEGFETLTSHRH